MDISKGLVKTSVITKNFLMLTRMNVYVDNVFIPDALVLWDTGSNTTCINYRLINKMNLTPIDNAYYTTSDNTTVNSEVFHIDLSLEDKVKIKGLKCIGKFLVPNEVNILIGMDIIGHGILVFNPYDNPPYLYFEVK